MEENGNKWKSLSNNQLFCTIVGAILGFVSALIIANLSNNLIIENEKSVSIRPLVETYLVNTGCVDGTVLEIDDVSKQFAAIHSAFEGYKSAYDDILKQSVDMAEENATLRSKLEMLDHQYAVDITAPYIKIDGEVMNNGNTTPGAVAQIDETTYYSEDFLNSVILSEPISFSSDTKTVNVGNPKEAKIRIDWDRMVFNANIHQYFVLEDNKVFNMSNQAFTEGVVLARENYFYMNLDGDYSKMTFTYGHVDGYPQKDLKLFVYALDDNGETYTTILDTIELKGEMVPKECEVMLNYAKAIKIVISDGHAGTRFGLSDWYLYA